MCALRYREWMLAGRGALSVETARVNYSAARRAALRGRLYHMRKIHWTRELRRRRRKPGARQALQAAGSSGMCPPALQVVRRNFGPDCDC